VVSKFFTYQGSGKIEPPIISLKRGIVHPSKGGDSTWIKACLLMKKCRRSRL
jgi:hypothetical protein